MEGGRALNGYRLNRPRVNGICLICQEPIKAGQECWKNSSHVKEACRLCNLCMNQWNELGGRLGEIPRAKTKLDT